jgi:hypothetical protein
MHHRPSLPTAVALAAAALLALPAAAGAASTKTVSAGPLKVKGYSMTILATDAGSADSLSIVFDKAAGSARQMHSYTFARGVAVAVKGSTATIKGSLGRFGSVNLRLAAGRKARGAVPKGCTGTPGTTRKGVAKGKLKLVADSTFFKTVAAKKLTGAIYGAAKLDCRTMPAGSEHGLMLTSSVDAADGQLMLTISRDGAGKVTQTVMRSDAEAATAPASVFHMISAPAGAAGLAPSADLSSATAAAAGPFLAGSLRFDGEAMAGMSMGRLSGDFAARFDSIGTQQLAAGGPDAMLMQR